MMHKAWSRLGKVPYCFSRSSVKFQGHTALKIVEFDPDWAFPDCNSSLNSPNGYDMMHKAWSSVEEVPYCFTRSSVKFQGHTAQKSSNLTHIGRFRTVTPVWIHQWLRNDVQTWSSIEEVPYCFSRSSVKFQGHTAKKIVECDPNWAFPDCNSSLNSPMPMKWCTNLEVA